MSKYSALHSQGNSAKDTVTSSAAAHLRPRTYFPVLKQSMHQCNNSHHQQHRGCPQSTGQAAYPPRHTHADKGE